MNRYSWLEGYLLSMPGAVTDYKVVPGFYSDKRNWNSVYLDGALPDDVLRDFCGMSYELVFQKLTKRAQREIMEQEEKRSS